MPRMTLRLTDEQHADLVAVSHREQRSVHGEVIYRCFGRFNQTPVSERGSSAAVRANEESGNSTSAQPLGTVGERQGGQPRSETVVVGIPDSVEDIATVAGVAERLAKPDFGSKLKK